MFTRLVKFLEDHSVLWNFSKDSNAVRVLDIGTRADGTVILEWIEIPATWDAVTCFLGY